MRHAEEAPLQTSRFHILLKAWIAIAAVVLAHATAVSGGVAEPIYLWQLRRYQAVDEGTTMLALLAMAIGLPALALTFVTPVPESRQCLSTPGINGKGLSAAARAFWFWPPSE